MYKDQYDIPKLNANPWSLHKIYLLQLLIIYLKK